jgi:hypothetical protein
MSSTTLTEIDWEQFEAEELEKLARMELQDSARRWAKYPKPNPFSQAYGYGSTLYKLKGDMDNPRLTPLTRREASKAIAKITRQLKDKQLMGLRERLIKASRAGDEQAIHRITQTMRDYLGEDRESGIYGAE